MQLDNVQVSTIEGNMPIRSKTKMTISEVGADILMDNLSNLYNDPLLAVIREYYANGYDSHKKAGVDRPVEIILPSRYNPSYVVRDYGTGMSEDFINEVYCVYGESTKREDNFSIGAFGLGSKSGFSISEQFTVTSFHEGKKISVLFQKGEEGSFDAIVVSVLETDEPNGVIVTVPIDQNSIDTFVERAEDFFQYVDRGSVLINGKAPNSALEGEDVYTVEEGDIKVTFKMHHRYSSIVRFVMGGIPYVINEVEVADSFIRNGHNVTWGGMDINFIVPLASFNLTGNREGVRATTKTKALLDRATSIYAKSIHDVAQKAVDKANDYVDALGLWVEWERYVSKPLTWKGSAFATAAPTKTAEEEGGTGIQVSKTFLSVQDTSYRSQRSHYRNRVDFRTNSTIITGKSPEDFEKENLRHAGIYLKNLCSDSYLYVVESIEDYFEDRYLPMIYSNSRIKIIDFDDFRKEVRDFETQRRAEAKAARLLNGPAVKAAPKPKPSFPVLDLTSRNVEWIAADKINEQGTVYLSTRDMNTPYDPSRGSRRVVSSYASKIQNSWKKTDRLAEALSAVTDARSVVLLSGAKTPESLKKHSGKSFANVVVEAKKRVESVIEGADSSSVKKLNASESKEVTKLRKDLGAEYIDRIEDPDLKGMILRDEQVVEKSPAIFDALEYLFLGGMDTYNLRYRFEQKANTQPTVVEEDLFNFEKRYPLLNILRTDSWQAKKEQYDDVIEYLNTKYQNNVLLTANS